MTAAPHTRDLLPPRLLPKGKAAAYCGVCVSIFDKACPVEPIKLLGRVARYDRKALDAWIDSFNAVPDAEDELNPAKVWDDWERHSSARA